MLRRVNWIVVEAFNSAKRWEVTWCGDQGYHSQLGGGVGGGAVVGPCLGIGVQPRV